MKSDSPRSAWLASRPTGASTNAHALRRRGRGQAIGDQRIDRAHVDDHAAGAQVREHAARAADDVFDDRRVVGSIVKTMSLSAATAATSPRGARAELLERAHRLGIDVEHDEREALAAQVRRHGPAHVAEPDESDRPCPHQFDRSHLPVTRT